MYGVGQAPPSDLHSCNRQCSPATCMLMYSGFLAETRMQSGNDGKLELIPRATLVEARGSLRDVAFAPSEFGMKLVSPFSIVQ